MVKRWWAKVCKVWRTIVQFLFGPRLVDDVDEEVKAIRDAKTEEERIKLEEKYITDSDNAVHEEDPVEQPEQTPDVEIIEDDDYEDRVNGKSDGQ